MESVQVGSVYEKAVRQQTRFMVIAFAFGIIVALTSAVLYWRLTPPSPEKLFHVIVIVGAFAYSFPAFTTLIRLSVKGYYLGVEQAERLSYAVDGLKTAQEKAPHLLENAKSIMDKAIPIANNVEEIVTRAKGMAGDVETIAHKVRSTMDSMNGSLDIKVLEGHLREVKESLKAIAAVFTGGASKEDGSPKEFEFFTGRKRR
jgi:hypothetical protein